MRNYVTAADAAFLPRLKALHASMLRHCQPFTLNVLPWDAEVQAWAETASGVVPHGEFAEAWQTCPLPGAERSQVERMWSARASLTSTLLGGGVIKDVCQVDADVFFFASPERAFAEVERVDAPAGVMPHYFARAADGLPGVTAETHAVYGLNNAGSVFLRSADLAKTWAKQTREWCRARAEGWLYADQRYLDEWGARGAVEFPPWAFPGPWTSKRYEIQADGDGRPWITDRGFVGAFSGRLVAWHFSSLRITPDGTVTQYANPEYALAEETIRVVYEPYVAELRKAMGL